MRGGLDDALDKLARRDELRRRTAGEATGTPPAVQELVEVIAGVVGHNPKLKITVGVEGAGQPLLLHFTVEDGVVHVSADNTVASRVADAPPTPPRHADFDFDIDIDDSEDEAPQPGPRKPAYAAPPEPGQETRRISYDDVDRYGTGAGFAAPAGPTYPDDTLFAEYPYEGHRRYDADPAGPGQATRRINVEHHRAPEDSSVGPRPAARRGSPAPLPEPVPLTFDTRETEQAAKRIAALLRDNPTLLRQSHQD